MKLYTQADAEQAAKVLFFEGAGCVERGDVENCRIRTAFRNDEGTEFYLELSGFERNKFTPKSLSHFSNVGHADHAKELLEDGDKCRFDLEATHFEYSKAGILEFVNKNFGCSFTEIRVADLFYGYHVHKTDGGCKLMEEHTFDDVRAAAAREAYNKVDMEIRTKLGSKYTKISLYELGEDFIVVRCYANDEAMRKAGMDPKSRRMTIKF